VTTALQAASYVVVAVLGVAVVVCRDPLRQTMVLGIFGLTLTLLFVALGAPDVAISEVVVSTVAFPVVLLATISGTRHGGREQEEDR